MAKWLDEQSKLIKILLFIPLMITDFMLESHYSYQSGKFFNLWQSLNTDFILVILFVFQ